MLLDVETTGHGDADIIEFAAVTPAGVPLVECLIRPRQPIPPFITQLTGITEAMVADASSFAAVFRQYLAAHLTVRKLLVYNVGFDVPVLRKNIQRHCGQAWEPLEKACLMRAYARYRGERYPPEHPSRGQVRVLTLEVACRQMGVAYEHGHRALHDCQVSARLLQAMTEG
jgi:DNA polymerase III subunit epsilon